MPPGRGEYAGGGVDVEERLRVARGDGEGQPAAVGVLSLGNNVNLNFDLIFLQNQNHHKVHFLIKSKSNCLKDKRFSTT